MISDNEIGFRLLNNAETSVWTTDYFLKHFAL